MKKTIFVAFVVSLGGFLFGFDAGIISGVVSYAGPQFDLNDAQLGWVVSSPSFAAMISMLFTGRLSDIIGRKKILIVVAFLYAVSAILSAYATSYEMLYIARMIGGFAFGAALILAPTYIAEISSAENRGKLVSMQQLNIVLGFFAAFISNYLFNQSFSSGTSTFLTEENIWRWMLGVEFFPAFIYFILMFFVPLSPRWLFTKQRIKEAKAILVKLHGPIKAEKEALIIQESLQLSNEVLEKKVRIGELLKPALRFVITIGLILGILQQITGINAVYFYATSIFKQTGIGTDAAFSSGVLLSFITVVFTIAAMFLIDKMGRRPLLLVGISGIAVSLLLCAYGFSQATYELTSDEINSFKFEEKTELVVLADRTFNDDVEFKNALKSMLGTKIYGKNEGAILEAATNMNAVIVLIGIMGFIACFAFSLGPVMWVMLSELFPNRIRGLAIGVIGFVNSFISWVVQQVFPWELSNLGNAMSFLIFGLIATVGVVILFKYLPETKGKSLEQIEAELIRT